MAEQQASSIIKTTYAQIESAAKASAAGDWKPKLAKTGMDPERFLQGVFDAVKANPRLLECGTRSIMNAAGKAAGLGLDISGQTGEAFLVGPLGKEKRCEMWRGVQGTAKLVYRSGMVSAIRPGIVREGDDFALDMGNMERPISHTPRSGTKDILAWYCIVGLRTGGQQIGVVWRDEAPKLCNDARARLGSAFDRSPWKDHYDAMLLKDAVARALKWAPKSVEQVELLAVDDDKPDFAPMTTAPEQFNASDPDVWDVETGEVQQAPQPAPALAQAPAPMPIPVAAAAEPAKQPVQQRRSEAAPQTQVQQPVAAPSGGDVGF